MNQVNFHVKGQQPVVRLPFATGFGGAVALLLMLTPLGYGESVGVPLPPLPQQAQAMATQTTETGLSQKPKQKVASAHRRRHTSRMLSQSVSTEPTTPAAVVAEPEPIAANPPLPALPEAEKTAAQPDGYAQFAQETPTADISSMDETPLEDLYKQREERYGEYTSTGYLFKVFGLLALLLGGFYALARYVFPRWLASKKSDPLIPFASNSQEGESETPSGKKPLLQTLLTNTPLFGEPSTVQPQILSRTRLSPTKEIHVIQIGDRRLVIGSTAQNMTLLAELPVEKPVAANKKEATPARTVLNDDDMQQIYRKYLKPGATPPQTPQGASIPEEEEVVLLDDYEDHFERLS